MVESPRVAQVAALIGEPARANILLALKDGPALTASELAHVAGVSPPTASSHLAKLAQARLVRRERRGRHRYYRLAGPRVAEALESLAVLTPHGKARVRRPGPRDQALRFARSCYDHLAGRLGVALTWALVERGLLRARDDAFILSKAGTAALSDLGIDAAALGRGRRPLTRRCLDWSERRPHLGGALGAALFVRMQELAWLERGADARDVRLTRAGRRGLKRVFGLDPPPAPKP